MIETKALLSFLGCAASETNLIDYLKVNNILLNGLALEEDDFDAYVEKQEFGFCLMFTDEAKFLGLANQPIGHGKLYFSTVFFYSEGKDNYSEYQGTLPFGLSFNDTRTDALAKLGTQSWQRVAKDGARVISDRWDNLPDVPYRLHVTYDKQTGKISILSASIPDKSLS